MSLQDNFIANAANFSSFLFNEVEGLNWVGFYMMDGEKLILGPFMGKPACIEIAMGKGVCGVSAERRETVISEDVSKFPGYICCDEDCKSEIVIPLIKDDILYGVLDIDSPVLDRFHEEDKKMLEELLNILSENSKLKEIKKYYK